MLRVVLEERDTPNGKKYVVRREVDRSYGKCFTTNVDIHDDYRDALKSYIAEVVDVVLFGLRLVDMIDDFDDYVYHSSDVLDEFLGYDRDCSAYRDFSRLYDYFSDTPIDEESIEHIIISDLIPEDVVYDIIDEVSDEPVPEIRLEVRNVKEFGIVNVDKYIVFTDDPVKYIRSLVDEL